MFTVNLYIRVLRALRDKLASESAKQYTKYGDLSAKADKLRYDADAALVESRQLQARSDKLAQLLDDE